MNVIVAVNEKSIEDYIPKIQGVKVLKVLRNNRTLYKDVLELKPHLIIVSYFLAGKERIEDILSKIRMSQPDTRIAYIYGKDDMMRIAFQDFLYNIGIYDFHYCNLREDGEAAHFVKEDIDRLVCNPLSKEDVSLGKLTVLETKFVREQFKEQLDKKAEEKERVRKQLTRELTANVDDTIEDEIEQKVVMAVEKELVVDIQLIEWVEKKQVVQIQTEPIIETKFVKKQTIAALSVFSPKLKDYFVSNIAHLLAKKTNQKILIIDFESPFPTLDHRFDTDIHIDIEEIYNAEELTGVSACLSALKKNLLNANTIAQYAKKLKGYKNLSLLTGLNNLNKFEDASKEDIYAIIDYAEQAYDTVILSLNSFILNGFTYCGMTKASRIIFVSECDFTDARAELSYMKEYIKNFKLDANVFNILPFGTLQSHDDIEALYREYTILGYIKDNPKYKHTAYKKSIYLDGMAAKDDIQAYINILIKMGFVPKDRFLSHIPLLSKMLKN